jgi:hypothetical protein
MIIQWTHVLDRLTQVNLTPAAVQLIAQRGVERLAQNETSKQAWQALQDTPPSKLRTQLLKALQLCGLSDTLTEEVWRRFMFQAPHAVPSGAADDLFHDALEIAATRINDLEWPPLNNHGDDLIPYRQAAAINLGDHWCMAFVYWCVGQAARNLEVANPLARTGSCKKQWEHAQTASNHGPLKVVPIEKARLDQGAIKPGAIFIHQYGDGSGHTGFVEAIQGQQLITIEGNTNPFGLPRVGLGVYRCTHRSLTDANLAGFIQL